MAQIHCYCHGNVMKRTAKLGNICTVAVSLFAEDKY